MNDNDETINKQQEFKNLQNNWNKAIAAMDSGDINRHLPDDTKTWEEALGGLAGGDIAIGGYHRDPWPGHYLFLPSLPGHQEVLVFLECLQQKYRKWKLQSGAHFVGSKPIMIVESSHVISMDSSHG